MRLLYLGPVLWHSTRQRPHHLAARLLREFPGAYVEPVGLRSARLSDLRRLTARCTDVGRSSEVSRIRPRYVPFLGTPGVDGFNRRWLWRQMQHAFPFEAGPWTLWASTPSLLAEALIAFGRPSLVVYDCMDRYAAFHRGRAAKRIDAAERRLVERADLVFASSPSLQERLSQWTSGVVLLSNGVETDRFSIARPSPPPPALAGMEGPIVGFHGTLGEWVDYGLLRSLASARPRWSFVLVGPVHSRRAREVLHLDNVHFTGPAFYDELPQLAACFDAGILPFVNNELTRHVFPLKVLEYLALGLPCVASPLPDLRLLADSIATAGDLGAWMTALDRAVSEPRNTAIVAHRRALARLFDWNSLADRAATRLKLAMQRRCWRHEPAWSVTATPTARAA